MPKTLRSSGFTAAARPAVPGVLGVLAMLVAACGTSAGQSAEPRTIPDSGLSALLLPADEIEKITGAAGMVARPPTDVMADNANIVSNPNCLGAWQVNQAPIYDPTFWKSMRQQVVRSPDGDDWTAQVVQSVVSWGTRDGAQAFFDDSAERWSNCTNHTLNIRVNDQPLPKWVSGDLSRTGRELSLPYTRGTGAQTRACQHVIRVAANVVFEIAACTPAGPEAVTTAADVAAAMEARMPH